MRRRVHTYEAESLARNLRETFTDKPVRKKILLDMSWPTTLQHVGDSLSVMYSSDKWKEDGDLELYKHLAESRNYVFVKPGFLRDRKDSQRPWKQIGPTVHFDQTPMPKHFACLAFFEGVDLRLYTEGTNENPRFGPRKDDGCVNVVVGHAFLGGSMILWSRVSDRKDQPFLFVYTEKDGLLMIILGEELDIEADGIVG